MLAKHSKHVSLEDSLAIGVDRIQRNFGPLKQQVEEWQALQLSTASAKLLIYQAFIEDELGFPKHLACRVHDLYFQPVHEEFQAENHVEPLECLHQLVHLYSSVPSVNFSFPACLRQVSKMSGGSFCSSASSTSERHSTTQAV